MPDAAGRFRGITVPAEAWQRVFGSKPKPRCGPWTDGRCEKCGRLDPLDFMEFEV